MHVRQARNKKYVESQLISVGGTFSKSTYFQKGPAMTSGTLFRMSLIIVAYASCFIHVLCSNESQNSEIHDGSAGKLTANFTRSNNSLSPDNERSDVAVSETPFSNVGNPISLEGGSTVMLNEKKSDLTPTTRKSVQNESLKEKNIYFETDQYNMGDVGPSTDQKPHKGRKGAIPPKGETLSEEVDGEHATPEIHNIGKPEISSVQSVNNVKATISTAFGAKHNYTMNTSLPVNGVSRNSTNSPENSTQLEVPSIKTRFNSSSSPADSKSLKLQDDIVDNTLDVTKMPLSPKPKPGYTRDDSDVEDHLSYSLTLAENDYVIPVVATIFAAPLLIVLAMFLYKRSKEFWERRHYRRMDFLIDGMYND